MGLFQSLESRGRTFTPLIRSPLCSLGLINRSNGLHFFRCVSVVRGIRGMQMRNAKQLHHSQRAALDGPLVTFDLTFGIQGNEPALKLYCTVLYEKRWRQTLSRRCKLLRLFCFSPARNQRVICEKSKPLFIVTCMSVFILCACLKTNPVMII